MKKKEQILRAFIKEKLEQEGWEADEKIMDAILSNVKIEEGTPPLDQEVRSTTIIEDTDGTHTSESIKLYNLIKIKNYDLTGFAIKQNAAIFTNDDKLKIAFTLLNLFHEFYAHTKHKFNPQDTKVLVMIYEQGGETFSLEKLNEVNNSNFTPPVSNDGILNSLNKLIDRRVIKRLGDNEYKAIDRIIYERTF